MFKGLLNRLLAWCGRKPSGVYDTYRPLTAREHARREQDNARKMQAAQEEFRRGPKPTPPTKEQQT